MSSSEESYAVRRPGFVERLYAAGATRVTIENICALRVEEEGPYAGAMTVSLPFGGRQRRAIFELIEEEGRPDNFDAAHRLRAGLALAVVGLRHR